MRNHHVPFAIKRVFYIYDVPTGGDRGAPHIFLHQILICLSNSYNVVLDDGHLKKIKQSAWKGLRHR